MPRNGSGTFTLVSGNPVVTGTTIESNWANTTLSDIATTLTDSLSRSGQGGMTAALRIADGSQGAPGVGFANETGSGFYRAGTGEVWAVVQGAQTLNLDANGVYVPADKTTTVDGAFVFNEAGADKDARFEGDTDANLLFTDASTDRVGVGTNTPTAKLDVNGTAAISGDVTLSAGTANGIAYLNASKVLTSGSNITFDGSNIQRITASSAALQLFKNSTPTVAARFAINTDYADAAEMSVYNGTSWAHNFVIDSTGYAAWRLGGSERMRLDSSGNLGLGVTPSAWSVIGPALQVKQASLVSESFDQLYLSANAFFDGSWKYMQSDIATQYYQASGAHVWRTAPSGTAGNAISFTQAMTLDASGNLQVGTSSGTFINGKGIVIADATAARLKLADTDAGVGTSNGLELGFGGATGSIYNLENGALLFGTNNTERARITSGGEVYIAGTTDQGAYNLQVNGTGVWGAGAYVNGSDERLKDNIQTLNDGLAVVSQLRPVTFQYKPEHSKDQSVQPGFIAQELQQAMAGKDYVDGVVQSGPEYLNVAYQNLIPILTKAIQEQQALIIALTARVAALEAHP